MKPISLNWQSGQAAGQRASRLLAQTLYVVLIERFMLVRLLLLVGLLVVALVIVVALLYINISPDTPPLGAPRQLMLDTPLIDEFELWLEERQAESDRSIMTGSREYFKL